MAEPARTSPLAGVADAERSIGGCRASDPHGVTFPRQADPARRRCRARAGCLERSGPTCPVSCGVRSVGETEVLWLGPDEWLVLTGADRGGRDGRIPAHRPSLARITAVVVVSDRMTGIGIAGARARDVLNAGCPLDLHPSAFPPGAVTRTLLAKAPVVLRRPAEPEAFELWVNGSFAPYAWLFLENAAREFGVAIAA